LYNCIITTYVVYSKKPVREDYCTYLTPATHLLALRREKAEVEQALVKQKDVRYIYPRSDRLPPRRSSLSLYERHSTTLPRQWATAGRLHRVT